MQTLQPTQQALLLQNRPSQLPLPRCWPNPSRV